MTNEVKRQWKTVNGRDIFDPRKTGDGGRETGSFRAVTLTDRVSDMRYKFEDLDVWDLSMDLSDHIYEITDVLPDSEKYNLKSQAVRAVTSISLNIAEGSTSQTDAEQGRFINYAIRSLIEVIACLRIMERRRYLNESALKSNTENVAHQLFIKLQAFRNALK